MITDPSHDFDDATTSPPEVETEPEAGPEVTTDVDPETEFEDDEFEDDEFEDDEDDEFEDDEDVADDEDVEDDGFEDDEDETPSGSERRIPYVPGLDGLRGIGVIFMMLYHAEVMWLGNGPLFTIEMFFVLSGYLIMALFLAEHRGTGTISLKRFWVRRARRLLPALIGICGLVAVWSLFSPPLGPKAVEIQQYRGDGVSSLLYGSNWWYIFSGQSYFAQFNAPSPFRHTWSLSIEEQFYLFVAVLAFFGLRRWGPTGKKWFVITVGGAVLAACWMGFLAVMYKSYSDGVWPLGSDTSGWPVWLQTFLNIGEDSSLSRPYLGTDTRIQASLMGMAAAFLLDRIDVSELPPARARVCGALGIGGLLVLFVGLQGHDTPWMYYGLFLLCDVLTVLAIVGLTSGHRTPLSKLLEWRPLVFVGTLSYSLYVWHFPIFVILDGSRVPLRGWPGTVVKIAVASVVAYASARFIENRIRYRGLPTRNQRILAAVAVAACVGAMLVTTAPKPQFVVAADGKIDRQLLIAGDSQAYTFALSIASSAQEDDRLGMPFATQMGCGLGQGDLIVKGRLSRQAVACAGMTDHWAQRIVETEAAASLVISWGWDVYDRRIVQSDGSTVDLVVGTPEWQAWYEGELDRGILALSPTGQKVILTTFPCLDLDADTPRHPSEESAEPQRVPALNDAIRAAAARYPDVVTLIDLNAFLCPDGRYRDHIDGELVSDDGIHFTPEGSRIVWAWMRPQVLAVLDA